MSESNPTAPPPADPLLAERHDQRAFVLVHAAPEYRTRLERMYDAWDRVRTTHFGGDARLRVPHLAIRAVSPRALSECRPYTGYGAETEICVSEGVAFGTNRGVVLTANPGAGLGRFVDDLVLRETVRQFVREVLNDDEAGYDGYGPRFVEHANRIARGMGLPTTTVPRLRRGSPPDAVPAARWPWGIRPAAYYGGEVAPPAPRRGSRSNPGPGPAAISRPITVMANTFEYFLEVLNADPGRLRQLLQRLIDAQRGAAVPGLARRELTPTDADGRAVVPPAVEPEWLTSADGRVPAMARFIRDNRAWIGMPILADALEEAGCTSAVLLDHLRAPHEHTSRCWALGLLAPPAEPE